MIRLAWGVVVVSLAACGGSSSGSIDAIADSGQSDGGVDAVIDGAVVDGAVPDAGPDAPPPVDAILGCVTAPPYTAPTPASVSIPAADLALWLRADLGVSLDDTSRVCEIDDLSGAGHDFRQLTAGSRPAMDVLGGQPALAVTGTQYLQHDGVLGIDGASARTIVIVVQLDATAARSTFFFQGQAGTGGTYLGPEANTFSTTGSRWGAYFTNNAYDTGLATSTGATVYVWATDSMTAGQPILSHLTVRANGAAQTLTRTAGGTGNTNIESFAGATYTWIGSGATAGADFQMAEALVWSRALSGVELGQVETYLMGRYGITP